jgi:hypothetical protein
MNQSEYLLFVLFCPIDSELVSFIPDTSKLAIVTVIVVQILTD